MRYQQAIFTGWLNNFNFKILWLIYDFSLLLVIKFKCINDQWQKKNDNSFKFIYIIEDEVIFRFFSFFFFGERGNEF